MSNERIPQPPTPAAPPCACVDPSPLYLWPITDVIELFPMDGANSPQARRLAIVVAEAQAAGQATAVLCTLTEWSRELLRRVPEGTPGRVELYGAALAAEALATREPDALPEAGRALCHEVAEISGAESPAERAAVELAHWVAADYAGHVFTPEQTWQTATAILCAVHEQGGDAAIARCAALAHAGLFWPPAGGEVRS